MKVYNYTLGNEKIKLPSSWPISLDVYKKLKVFTLRKNRIRNKRRRLQKQSRRVNRQ